MKQFDLVLKNEKVKSYKRIHLFILTGNIVSLLLLAVTDYLNTSGPVLILLAFWLFVVLCGVVITFIFKKQYFAATLNGALLWTSVCWLLTDYWFVFLIALFFGIIHIISVRKLLVSVTNEKIIYPSFPKKEIAWNELSNVVFKDGFITIDFKNNRLIQQLVDETQTVIDEKEFNEFCKHQLNKTRPLQA